MNINFFSQDLFKWLGLKLIIFHYIISLKIVYQLINKNYLRTVLLAHTASFGFINRA